MAVAVLLLRNSLRDIDVAWGNLGVFGSIPLQNIEGISQHARRHRAAALSGRRQCRRPHHRSHEDHPVTYTAGTSDIIRAV